MPEAKKKNEEKEILALLVDTKINKDVKKVAEDERKMFHNAAKLFELMKNGSNGIIEITSNQMLKQICDILVDQKENALNQKHMSILLILDETKIFYHRYRHLL